MDIKQALAILSQAIDLSVGSGAFKSAKDVAIISQASTTINEFVEKVTAGSIQEKQLKKVDEKIDK